MFSCFIICFKDLKLYQCYVGEGGFRREDTLSIDNFVTVLVVTAMLTVETVIAPVFLFYLFIFSIHQSLGCTMNVDLENLTIFV